MRALATLVGLVGAAALCACNQPPAPIWRLPKGVPMSDIAAGKVAPQVGLGAPFPDWAPLPERGDVIGAEVVAPQPPYGAAAVLMVHIDESFPGFVAAYRVRLAARGFDLRQTHIPPNLGIDAAVAAYEADERQGGHIVYVTLRGTPAARFAQLTFWAPPAPRIMY
jgi:hypothetical protein